ncbi:MAG: transcription antitermination factor NusB [Amaricoccus sp.]
MTVPGLAAREAAAGLLAGVLDRHRSFGDQVEAADGPLDGLAPDERARAQRLAAETLRHLGRIDAVLQGFLSRRPPAVALNALRLAVAELYLDGTPAHAAVDGAVRLARAGEPRLAGLVNAVGRRVAENAAAWEAAPEAGLPDWLAQPVKAAWGAEAAEAIAAAHRREAPLDLTLRNPAEAEAWSAALGAERLSTGSLRLARGAQVSALPGYDAGAWWMQDAAAALPVRLLGGLAGQRVLDLCAAPGGKTLQLAAAGAEVVALDASDARIGRLRENLARTGLAAEVVVADALAWEPDGRFDAVLLDAPCTASGTIRRHPDLPFLRRDRELRRLVELQAALLERAAGWVKPGGRLVYCVCSLLPAEGERQVARLLAAVPGTRMVAPDGVAGVEAGWVDATGGLRLRPDFWPERGGMDGFYAACVTMPGFAA